MAQGDCNFKDGAEEPVNEIINDRMKYNELNKYFLKQVEKRLSLRIERRFLGWAPCVEGWF